MRKKRHNSTRRLITSRNPRKQQKQQKKQEKPRIEVSAGGLAYKKTSRGLLFAMVKDSYGKWTFPKGHVKRGESYEDAAEREIHEEVGLKDLRFVKELGKIDIWFRDRYVFKGRLIHKFIYYYLFEVPTSARVKKPKPVRTGERIRDVGWVSAKEITDRSSYKDMQPIIQRAMAFLTDKRIV